MQKHVRIYLRFFEYGDQDFIPCESCGSRAVDVHHLEGRGKGKDVIENLMALCRYCHDRAHRIADSVMFNEELKIIHKKKLNDKTKSE